MFFIYFIDATSKTSLLLSVIDSNHRSDQSLNLF